MSKFRSPVIDRLFEAILTLESVDECYKFFEDACTVKEIQDIAQRLDVASSLSRGNSFAVVAQETGVSSATISRVNKCLIYGSDGYKMVIDRLNDKSSKENG